MASTSTAAPTPHSPILPANRPPLPSPTASTLDFSGGNSIYHSGPFRLPGRFSPGSLVTLLYTSAKSTDTPSTLGGGVFQTQNAIPAERALSSFDRRHNLRV